MNDLEHPDITAALRTGYPWGVPPMPICPMCNDECDTIYTNVFGDVVGCENCVKSHDAADIVGAYD